MTPSSPSWPPSPSPSPASPPTGGSGSCPSSSPTSYQVNSIQMYCSITDQNFLVLKNLFLVCRTTNGSEWEYLEYRDGCSGEISLNRPSQSEVWPFHKPLHHFFSVRLFDESLLFILPVTLLTVAWNIPKFFEFKTCYIPLKVKDISV